MDRRLFLRLAILALVATAPGGVRASAGANPLDAAPSRFAERDGVKIHYKSLGQGKTALVLVHGWSCDLTFWREQAQAPYGKLRVIAVDLPGSGKSGRPEVTYSMEYYARAVDAVLADAGVEKAVLAGHSMGTPVIRQFYRLFPGKTLALVAVDGAFRPYSTDPKFVDQMVSPYNGPDYKESIGRFVDFMFGPATPEDLKTSVKTSMQGASRHVAVSSMRAMFDPAIWTDDPVRVPTLLVLAKSPFWTAEYEAYVRKLIPDVDYRVMDGVGHFLMLEKPDAFNAILVEFLTKRGFAKA